MITSIVGRGLIYTGDSPFASTIVIEQTGPMELTVRAGSLTTTGRFRVVTPGQETAQILEDKMLAGEAILLPDGRVRVYLSEEGQILFPITYDLAQDQVVSIAPDAALKKFCKIELGLLDGDVEILVRYRLDNGFDYADYPAEWLTIEEIVYEFEIAVGQTSLGEIYVLSVLLGFPPNTGPEDWLVFTGNM